MYAEPAVRGFSLFQADEKRVDHLLHLLRGKWVNDATERQELF
jgi:hypothetical protein